MNYIYIIFIVLLLFSIAFSCRNKDEEERTFPQVETLEVTNITDEGAVFNGLVEGFLTNRNITDHGFCYGFPNKKAPLGYTRISLGKLDESSNSFHAQVSGDLFKDKTYSVIAYIESSNRIIYGTTASFVSKGGCAPEIKSFKPQVAGWGDTIKISGKYFSSKVDNNVVKFDQVKASVVSASDSVLRVIVPVDLSAQKSMIGVTTAEKTFLAGQPFLIGKPVIKNLTAKVPLGGTLNVKTQNVKGKLASFYVDGAMLTSTQVSLNEYNLVIPKSYSYGSHTLKIAVFGENAECSFHYDAPYISDISPKLAEWNDKLTIKGKNFKSLPNNSRIDFQGSNCGTYNFSVVNDSVIQLKVPDCATVPQCKVGILNDYFTIYTSAQLSLKAPELSNLINNQFCIGDEVIIEGKRIRSIETRWFIDGRKIDLTASFVDSTHVKVYIPDNLGAGPHKLRLKVNQLESNEIDFFIKKLVVKSIAEKFACRSGKLTILGENFARFLNQNVVKINGTLLDVIERTETYIKVQFPYNQSFDVNSILTIKVGLQEIVVPDDVTIVEPWEMVSSFDGIFSFGAKFTIGNRFYFSSGNMGGGEFYCFNADDKSLKRIADYPGGRVIAPVSFVLGTKAYVGLGYKESTQKFWSYDPGIDRWNEVADCPLTVYPISWNYGDNRNFTFVKGPLAFVGDFDGTMYKYNPGTNQWTLCTKGNDFAFGSKNVSFSFDNRCYLFSGTTNIRIREFNTSSNKWDDIQSYNYSFWSGANSSTYYEKLNMIIFEGYFPYSSNAYASLKYFDTSSSKMGFFFPSVENKAALFSTSDGRLFALSYDNNLNKLTFYQFNFSKYEQIKSLIEGNE